MIKIKKDDIVLVIAGKDRGKKGKVRFVHPKDGQLLVEHVNMTKKAARATGRTRQAGIIEREAPINASNTMLLCAKCDKPARIGFKFLEDDKKVRFCKSCNEVID
jgi:large subunit ribosomal protein L24